MLQNPGGHLDPLLFFILVEQVLFHVQLAEGFDDLLDGTFHHSLQQRSLPGDDIGRPRRPPRAPLDAPAQLHGVLEP